MVKIINRTKEKMRFKEVKIIYRIIGSIGENKLTIYNCKNYCCVDVSGYASYDCFVLIESILRGINPKCKSYRLKGEYSLNTESVFYSNWTMGKKIINKIKTIQPCGNIYRKDVIKIIKEWDNYFK